MKNIKYDESRPLVRLEIGDKARIMINKKYIKGKEKDPNKYKDVPDGIYEAVCVDEYKLECEEYPQLNGSYNYWRGDKRGTSILIYADEIDGTSF